MIIQWAKIVLLHVTIKKILNKIIQICIGLIVKIFFRNNVRGY